MVKGEFSIEAEVEGEVPEVERTCIQMFNTQWAIKANPLGTQIWYLLIGLNKATRYTPEELSVKPGLTLCGSIIDSKQKIDCTEHIKFVEGIITMTDSIINTCEAESEAAPQTRKRKREQKREISEKLYHAPHLGSVRWRKT